MIDLDLHGPLEHAALVMVWQTTLMFLVVTLLTAGLARVRASVRHAIWLVILVRFLLPPVDLLPAGIASNGLTRSFAWALNPFTSGADTPATDAPLAGTQPTSVPGVLAAPIPFDQVDGSLPSPGSTAPVGNPPDISTTLLLLWAAGMIIVACAMARQWLRLRRLLRRAVPPPEWVGALMEELQRELGPQRRNVACRLIQDNLSPFTTGLARPTIMLPAHLARTLDSREMRTVLAHELIHLRRHDLEIQILSLAVRTIYFFHPVAWLTCRQIRVEREKAADEAVVRLKGMDIMDYAHALIRVASLGPSFHLERAPSPGLSSNARELRGRLVNLTRPRWRLPGWPFVAPAVILLAMTMLPDPAGAQDRAVPGQAPNGQTTQARSLPGARVTPQDKTETRRFEPAPFVAWVTERSRQLGIDLPRVERGGPALAAGNVGGVVFLSKSSQGSNHAEPYLVQIHNPGKGLAPLPHQPPDNTMAHTLEIDITGQGDLLAYKVDGETIASPKIAARLRESSGPVTVYPMAGGVTLGQVARVAALAWERGDRRVIYGGVSFDKERYDSLLEALKPLRALSAKELYDSREILIVADSSLPWRANAEILQAAGSSLLKNPRLSLAVIDSKGKLCKISQYLPVDTAPEQSEDDQWEEQSQVPEELEKLEAQGNKHYERDEWLQALICYQAILNHPAARELSWADNLLPAVKQKLPFVYNALHLFDKARPMWDALGPENSKSTPIIKGAARCFGGWLEPANNTFIEIPGTGDYARAVSLWSKLFTDLYRGGNDKYSPEWWDIKFMTIYTRYRAGLTDPSNMAQARALLRNVKAFKPDLGGGVARQKFLWLQERLEK